MTATHHNPSDHPYADNELVLSTKLNIPRANTELVRRRRLYDKIGNTIRPLTLICAPAGFGKTTLLSAWLAHHQLPVAWVSLDGDDNDPAIFLRYVVAALQTIYPDCGRDLMQVLLLPQPPNIQSVLHSLINQISLVNGDIVLVLDDYHVITNDAIHNTVNYLLDNIPQQLYLAITSRREPSLALGRKRVRNQVSEITESELRFNNKETALFLNQISGLNLSEQDIDILAERTEGWIAGLQLAALSLENEQDRDSFIRAFAGDDRYIVDYLSEEVLQRQPDDILQFLLQTSLLDRLCGSLCDQVTGRSNSADLLERLERSNMFLIPLDNKRHWYRYHHLFAGLLQNRLKKLYPQKVAQIHHRAGEWFNRKSLPQEAIQHALAVNDYKQAALVLERHGQRLFEQGQSPLLMKWYQQLPQNIIEENPCHALKYAWCRFIGCGEVPVELISNLQNSLHNNINAFSDEDQLRMEIDLALLNGFQAMQQRHINTALQYAENVLKLCEKAGMPDAIPPRLLIASAWLASGKLKAAEQLFTELIEQAFNNEYLISLNASICGLGLTLLRQGRLQMAELQVSTHLARLQKKGWDQHLIDTAWVYLALGELAYQRNDLDHSLSQLNFAAEHAELDHWDTLPAMIEVQKAKVFYAKGDNHSARECIAIIQKRDLKPPLLPFFPTVQDSVAALTMYHGERRAAEQWFENSGLYNPENLIPELEWSNIQYVRLLLAQHQLEAALQLATKLLLEAEKDDRRASVMELCIVIAMARQAQGQTRQAVESLQRALALAYQEKFVRVFINEGASMAALLNHTVNGPHADFAQYLLQTTQTEPSSENRVKNLNQEPLSGKEQQTLELLIAGLSNKEIAGRLFVSTNTVKTHIKNIYRKLDVNNRVAAVAKGAKLISSNN